MAALLTGCAQPPEPEGPSIETTAELLNALTDAGSSLKEEVGLASAGSLEGGRTFLVDGDRVLVFEFDSESDRVRKTSAWLEAEVPAPGSGDALFHVWGRGRILVVYRGTSGGLVALLTGLLGDPLTVEPLLVDEPYPPSVAPAMAFLGEKLGLDPASIVVIGFESSDWPDACLGLGGPAEACAAVVTPGWRIELRAGAATYVLRTDVVGQSIRIE